MCSNVKRTRIHTHTHTHTHTCSVRDIRVSKKEMLFNSLTKQKEIKIRQKSNVLGKL
jgi:hypothetical protein